MSALEDTLSRHATASFSDASDVSFLKSPTHFHEELIRRVRSADKRVLLSALYFGTGDLSRQLAQAIHETLAEKPGLEVTLVLCRWRGTRNVAKGASSCDMFKQTLTQFGSRFRLQLFDAGQCGWLKAGWLPERVREAVATHHVKAFVCDDDVIVSGANLSDTYFSDRSDRYLSVHSPALGDYVTEYIETLRPFSSHAACDDFERLHILPQSRSSSELPRTLHDFTEKDRPTVSSQNNDGVRLFVSHQLHSAGIQHEQRLFSAMLQLRDYCFDMCTSYLNLLPEHVRLLSSPMAPKVRILTAAPQAHGWANSTGFSRHVPSFYEAAKCELAEHTDRVKLLEFVRENWSYHAKGWWLLPLANEAEPAPVVTHVTSSNLSGRSWLRDHELGVTVLSRRPLPAVAREHAHTFGHGGAHVQEAPLKLFRADMPRQAPVWVRTLRRAFRTFF
ncbi:MAG: hypothetical protein MHM6MM_001189 [Cercozoa sp. M6MM]